MALIGRKKEIEYLEEVVNSNKSELIVIKGRRRVGKTFLINSFFDNTYAFKCTGLSSVDIDEENDKAIENKLTQQLENFYISLVRYGYTEKKPKFLWL